MKRRFAILTALMFFSLALTSARATDEECLHFIGFSGDGKYLAFELYGERYSAEKFSKIHFVECALNKFAAPTVEVNLEDENATERQAREQSREKAAATLKKLGIIDGILGGNTGTHLLSRLPNDLGVAGQDDGSIDPNDQVDLIVSFDTKPVVSKYNDFATYKLKLTAVPVEVEEDKREAASGPFRMELVLTETILNKTTVLQKDKTLPKSRGFVIRYAIQDVYHIGDTIAVFVRYVTPGFEGFFDSSFLVVTGTVKGFDGRKFPEPAPDEPAAK